MKRKRIETSDLKIPQNHLIEIGIEETGEYYFEIGNEITKDISEAVSIMMRSNKWNDESWNTPVPKIDFYEIDPSRSLYWLTGGKDEWTKLENYKRTWSESCSDFTEEFGELIVSIVRKSKTLKDIRDSFIKNLSLPKLYDFALEKGIS